MIAINKLEQLVSHDFLGIKKKKVFHFILRPIFLLWLFVNYNFISEKCTSKYRKIVTCTLLDRQLKPILMREKFVSKPRDRCNTSCARMLSASSRLEYAISVSMNEEMLRILIAWFLIIFALHIDQNLTFSYYYHFQMKTMIKLKK